MLDLTLNSSIMTTDIWEAAMQEIDILFETYNTELIGYPEFGTNFDSFLWTLTPTTSALQQYISKKIGSTSFASTFKHHIQIDYKFDDVTYENIYTVKITLYNDYAAKEKTYNLTKQL